MTGPKGHYNNQGEPGTADCVERAWTQVRRCEAALIPLVEAAVVPASPHLRAKLRRRICERRCELMRAMASLNRAIEALDRIDERARNRGEIGRPGAAAGMG
jgi:hypothetical protein